MRKITSIALSILFFSMTAVLAQETPVPQLAIPFPAQTTLHLWHGNDFWTSTTTPESGTILNRWHGETGESQIELAFPANTSFSWSGNQEYAAASNNESLSVWSTTTGELLWETPAESSLNLVWNASDTRLMGYSFNDPVVNVWDAATGEIVLTLTAQRDRLQSAQWSPDEQRILTVVTASVSWLTVWDATTGDRLIEVEVSGETTSAEWNGDGSRILWSGRGLQLIDSQTGEVVLESDERASPVWHPDRMRVILARELSPFPVWDTAVGQEVFTISPPVKAARWPVVTWSPDGTRLVTSGESGLIVFDGANGQVIGTLNNPWGLAPVFEWSPDDAGSYIAVQGELTPLLIIDGRTSQLLHSLSESTTGAPVIGPHSVTWSHDGTQITNFDGDDLLIWDSASGQLIHRLPIRTRTPIEGLTGMIQILWHPDHNRLLTHYGSFYAGASEVQLWEID